MSGRPTVVIVPGLRGPAPTHWQTWLGHRLADRGDSAVTLPLWGREHIDLDERIAALEAAVQGADGPVLLVAHSAGVVTTVHWARRHPASAVRVAGALLATPPDLVSPLGREYPSLSELVDRGWAPVPAEPLPFPGIVAISTSDSIGDPERIAALAAAWGCRTDVVGDVGHLNPASGFGPWPHAEALLEELLAAVVAS